MWGEVKKKVTGPYNPDSEDYWLTMEQYMVDEWKRRQTKLYRLLK